MSRHAWLLGSNNRKKSEEMRAILSSFGVDLVTLSDAGLVMDVEEWGDRFAINGALKAVNFAQAYDGVAIADDSGLSVIGLDGMPGVYSARYAGEDATDASNNQKLQAELALRPNVSRRAFYHCTIAIAVAAGSDDPLIQRLRKAHAPQSIATLEALQGAGGYLLQPALTQKLASHAVPMELWLFHGDWHGEIATEAKGEGGFGYDPYFRLDDGRHVAELPDDEKNSVSHRAQALQELSAALR